MIVPAVVGIRNFVLVACGEAFTGSGENYSAIDISRLRLDASLFALPSKRTSRTMGRPAYKGPARPKL